MLASSNFSFSTITTTSVHNKNIIDLVSKDSTFPYADPMDEIKKIETRKNRTVDVLFSGDLPLGAIVYKDNLEKSRKELGKCLSVRSMMLLEPKQCSYGELLKRAFEVAKVKLADGVLLKIASGTRPFKACKANSFRTVRTWREPQETELLFSQLRSFSKRKGSRSILQKSLSSRSEVLTTEKSATETSYNQVTKRKAKIPIPGQNVLKRARTEEKKIAEPLFQTGKIHDLTLKNPYLGQIKSGAKTIEGRINSGMMRKLRLGDAIRFYNRNDEVTCIIKGITPYPSFFDMLQNEGVDACLPGIRSASEGSRVYDRIPGYSERARRNGVLAIHLGKYSTNSPKEYRLTLKNPYLGQIKSGTKTIEGRINSGIMRRLRDGDIINFYNHSDNVTCRIVRITSYPSFFTMLDQEGVQACLPGVRSTEEGARIYDRIPNYADRAKRNGVLAIALEKIT